MADSLKIITIKANGDLMKKLKENTDGFCDYINQYDVILLQDTNVVENPDETPSYEIVSCHCYGLHKDSKAYRTNVSENKRGVAVIINTSHVFKEGSLNRGNYIVVCVEIGGSRYRFVSFYFDEEEQRALLDRFVINNKGKHGILVIGGDFNVAIDPNLDIVHDNDYHTGRRNMFENWITTFTDVWRNKNKKAREYTKITPSQGEPSDQQSRLDYFFMRNQDKKYVETCVILPDMPPTADHKAVTLTLKSTGKSGHDDEDKNDDKDEDHDKNDKEDDDDEVTGKSSHDDEDKNDDKDEDHDKNDDDDDGVTKDFKKMALK